MIPNYDYCANLQEELRTAEGPRKDYLQSKHDKIYSDLMNILYSYKLSRPRPSAPLCYLRSWTEARAREAGLINRTFDPAILKNLAD
jgi:hypothetical protein